MTANESLQGTSNLTNQDAAKCSQDALAADILSASLHPMTILGMTKASTYLDPKTDRQPYPDKSGPLVG
jgi:hypothetical protein